MRTVDLEAGVIDVDLEFLGDRLTSSRCSRTRSTGSAGSATCATRGREVEAVDYRATTTLSGASVDDTPFGGGAGMVLRVDVVEWALRAALRASTRSTCASSGA